MLVTVISQHRGVASAPPHLGGGHRVVSGGSLGVVGAGVDPGRARVRKPTDALQPLQKRIMSEK